MVSSKDGISGMVKYMVSSKDGKSGMNGVGVARHGLIFGEDGATGSRKVF